MTHADDLILFARIVEAGGFSAAGKRWGLPPATLSRRLKRLEKSLGISLIYRTSRQFAVTDFGLRVYQRSLNIMHDVDEVYNEASDLQKEPSGRLRISCPVVISQFAIGKIAAEFAKQHPRVQLALEVTNRTVDPVSDRFDLVIRPTPSRLDDAETVAQKIAVGHFWLVASPGIAQSLPSPLRPEQLQHVAVIGFGTDFGQQHWVLKDKTGMQTDFPVNSVYVSDNLFAIREAALIGLGVAALPVSICREAIDSGKLIRVCPGWSPSPMEFFALYPSRRGLAAAGRRFVEYLQKEMSTSIT
jgi:DNA-binding transcriptional LysR family regulator